MKKLLILAYDFPPYVSVGGLRPYSWYKYLKDFNVYPIVVTRQWTNVHGSKMDYITPGTSNKNEIEHTKFGTIIKAPYTPTLANKIMLKFGEQNLVPVRKIITGTYEILQWFFMIGSKKTIYRGADEYLKNNKVDAIIATGDPFILFRYASMLSKKYNIPFIADYRDPWSQNNERYQTYLKRWNLFLEKKYTKDAETITTVSEFFEKKIKQINKTKLVYIIRNGYDLNALQIGKNIISSKDILKIGFIGTIYPYHPWRTFLRVLNKFYLDNPEYNIEVSFWGINIQNEIAEEIDLHYPYIKNKIIFHNKTPNDILLNKLASLNAFLLFNYYSIIGTKIYDYLALQRKIIFCFSNDAEANSLKEKYYKVHELDATHRPQEELIQSTHAGVIVENADQLYDVWKDLHEEFDRTGSIVCHTQHVEEYSRKYQAGKLAEIIYEIRNSKDYLI
jgi:glycosyltransferase involved in cell wall biosynthesis